MKKIFIIFILPVVYFLLISCNSLNNSDTATVTIDTGIGSTKAAAPSDVTSISVTVSGSGMSDITESIPTDTGVLTLEVPIGSARLFSVTALAGNFTYLGSTTQDIAAGETVVVSISMVRQVGTLNITIPNQSEYAGTVQSFIVTVAISETSGYEQAIFTPSETITMEVPPGTNRGISLITTPLSQSAVVSFSTETATTDFIHGQPTPVTLSPVVIETKIVIPDPNGFTGTPRLCQIDDINGGWATPLTAISGVTQYKPYDIDFDSQGRIYIANNETTGGDYIIRIDDINGGNPLLLGANGSGYNAIAIDRINNIIYSTRSDTTLWQCNIGSTTFNEIILSGITFTSIRGLAVDDNGNLYIAATTSGPVYEVIKWTPPTLTNFTSYSTNLDTPWDVVVKENYLYVTNIDGADGYKIIQLDLNLNLTGNNGNQSPTEDSVPGNFYGPKRFLAILNRGFFILDEGSMNETSGFQGDRLVYFDDISLNGWQTFGSTGPGTNQFNFFWEC